jgi:polysaccharide deacetylase 2 family uncharacterized protein YibQ
VAFRLAVVILSVELVYRLVALPPDYQPERQQGALADARTTATATAEPAIAELPEAPTPSLSISRLHERVPHRTVVLSPATHARSSSPGRAAFAPAASGDMPDLRFNRLIDRSPDRALGTLDREPPLATPTERAAEPAAVGQPIPPSSAKARSAKAAPAASSPLLVGLPIVPRSVPRDGERPKIAIVIDDMGYSPASLARLAKMPGPLTLAFLPAADATSRMLEVARSRDFELMVHLPMEPIGDANPGPEALLVDLDERELRRRVRWALDRVPGAVGVNNHMGSRFTVFAAGLEIVMDELRGSRLFFVDSRTNPASMAERMARRFGIPSTGRDIFIDHDPGPAAIARQLARIERFAARNGAVIAIGHPYATTLAALEAWLPTLAERGFRLVRLSEVLAERLCAEIAAGGEGCGPALHLVGSDGAVVRSPRAEAVP